MISEQEIMPDNFFTMSYYNREVYKFLRFSPNISLKKRKSKTKGVKKMFDKLALLLVIIGGLNWGSVGIFNFDAVAWIFGGQTAIGSRIVYVIVALAAIWCITLLFRDTEAAHDD